MKKIILFSPTGYVGSLIKEYILQEKEMQLFEITRDSKLDEFYGEYDIMIYSASVMNAESSKFVQDNVLTAITSIDFCRKHRVKRIIYLSSDSIYGELNTNEVDENAVMVNPDFYGITKYLAEKTIIDSGISYYILRLPGIVGRSWGRTYLYRLIDKIDNQETITVYNAEKMFNNVLDIDDLAHFIMILCGQKGKKSEIFLLGNTEKVELIKVVNYIKESCHSDSKIETTNAEGKRYFTLNVSKAVAYGYSSKSIWDIIDNLYYLKKKGI